jgi:ABC-type proline/glycine betaine transport system permease subunit
MLTDQVVYTSGMDTDYRQKAARRYFSLMLAFAILVLVVGLASAFVFYSSANLQTLDCGTHCVSSVYDTQHHTRTQATLTLIGSILISLVIAVFGGISYRKNKKAR